jgi:Concanavalin A-like lectin/glucanases superfamily
MAAATQWRIVGIRTYGGGELELSALHLLAASGRVDAAAVLSCSHAPSRGTLPTLQNASPVAVVAFRAQDVASAGFTLAWQFSTAVEIQDIKLFAGDARSAFAGQLDFEYFDGSRWVHVATLGWLTWPGVRGALTVDARGASSDPQFAFVKALLHLNGVDGSTSIVDATGRTWSAGGTAKISTTASKFGGASLYVTPAGYSNYAQTDDAPDIRPGLDPYTVEFFYRPLSLSNWRSPFQKGTWNSGGCLTMIVGSSSIKINSAGSDSGDISHGLSTGRMFHIALSRDPAGTARLFVDGKVRGSFSQPQNLNGTNPLQLFAGGGIISPDEGWIDEFRFTVGYARYTAEFTPPDAPFPDAAASQELPPVMQSTFGSRVAHSAALPDFCAASPGRMLIAQDVEFGGMGHYPFKVEGLAGSQKAKVSLLRARDRLLARETWSAADGTGAFTGLDLATKFIAVAQDPSGLLHPCGAEHFPELPDTTGGA